jgi:NAD dependent epimerase/dehydratase family enzyme
VVMHPSFARRHDDLAVARAIAAAPAPPALFVWASAVGCYGARGNEVVTEDGAAGSGFLGEMADAALFTGQRVVPARAQALGFRYRWPALEAVLRELLGK